MTPAIGIDRDDVIAVKRPAFFGPVCLDPIAVTHWSALGVQEKMPDIPGFIDLRIQDDFMRLG